MPRWVQLLSRLPWWLLYGLSYFLVVLAHRVFGYRRGVIRRNLAASFPDLDARGLRRVEKQFLRNISEIIAELIKASTISAEELRSRVTFRNLEVARKPLESGQSVLILAAHCSNWEWLQLALSEQLGFPLDAGYKPQKTAWSEQLLRAVRSRFGSRLIPAKSLLTEILARRKEVRAIALLADQSPVSSDFRWWTQFLNQPTAFYMGPEKIARAARFPMVFAWMRRVARGRYEVEFHSIIDGRTTFEPGEPTEQYARLVEEQIRAAPGDWIWSHRRWKIPPPEQTANAA